jgi:hypothetical protein
MLDGADIFNYSDCRSKNINSKQQLDKYCKNCFHWQDTGSKGLVFGYCSHIDSFTQYPDTKSPWAIVPQDANCSQWKKKTT